MHKMIIFGYKELGREIAGELKNRKVDFIIATNDIDDFHKSQKEGFDSYFLEDLTEDSELVRLGIGTITQYIFCVCEDESINIFLTISARALDSNLKIIAEAGSSHSKHKFELAGANKVIDPYEISATRIFNIIKKPQVVKILDDVIFSKDSESTLSVAEILIESETILDGVFLSDVNLREFNIILLGLIDKEKSNDFKFFTSDYNPKLDYGDTLIVIGKIDSIELFKTYAKGQK